MNEKLDIVENISRESLDMMECGYNGEMKKIELKLRIEIDGKDILKRENVEEIDRSLNVEKCDYS